jgi:predicted Zn-dependent protease
MPTRVPPISEAGEAFEPEKDEKRLWIEAQSEEQKFLEKAILYDDPLLEDYLDGIAGELAPEGLAAQDKIAVRVRILKDPTLNAFAYPHGSLYVHTGLLARLENEDQIAGVLAHEMTHVENRHMLRHRRSAQNKQIGFMLVAIAASVWAASEAGEEAEEGNWGKAARISVLADLLLGIGLQLAFIAAVNGYGRDLEREADDGAFDKMSRSGYNPAQMERIYELLMDDHGDGSKMEVFFFGSHPQLKERIENTHGYLASHPEIEAAGEEPAVDPAEFHRRVRSVLKDDALLNIEAGRFGLAEHELERAIEIVPEDHVAHYLLGTLYIRKANTKKEEAADLRQKALRYFDEAARLDPSYPDPHKELGLAAYRDGDYSKACKEFQLYTELAPTASDVGRFKDYLLELKSSGQCQ